MLSSQQPFEVDIFIILFYKWVKWDPQRLYNLPSHTPSKHNWTMTVWLLTHCLQDTFYGFHSMSRWKPKDFFWPKLPWLILDEGWRQTAKTLNPLYALILPLVSQMTLLKKEKQNSNNLRWAWWRFKSLKREPQLSCCYDLQEEKQDWLYKRMLRKPFLEKQKTLRTLETLSWNVS